MQQARLFDSKKDRYKKMQHYDEKKLYEEMNLFVDWYLIKYKEYCLAKIDLSILDKFFKFIAKKVSLQPQVFVHRDFHSRNLMFLRYRTKSRYFRFSGCVVGPITYD